jgi:hypothetical protein
MYNTLHTIQMCQTGATADGHYIHVTIFVYLSGSIVKRNGESTFGSCRYHAELVTQPFLSKPAENTVYSQFGICKLVPLMSATFLLGDCSGQMERIYTLLLVSILP